MALMDTKINKQAMADIVRALDPVIRKPPKKDDRNTMGITSSKNKGFTHERLINGLDFRYCYLDLTQIRMISLALQVNRTLIKLDLSNNAMNSISGLLICEALKENMTLMDLNLARNRLCDMFAEGFAEALRVNEVIWRVDISENRFTKKGS